MGTTERLFDIALGGILLTVAFYLAAKPARQARIIQDYYQRRKDLETARGWWGKTVFLPGRRMSLAILFLIIAAALVMGSCGVFVGLRG